MWHNNSHSSTTGAINKQKKTMAITSAKHGNNICQQQKVAITSATKMAITSAKHGTINKQK